MAGKNKAKDTAFVPPHKGNSLMEGLIRNGFRPSSKDMEDLIRDYLDQFRPSTKGSEKSDAWDKYDVSMEVYGPQARFTAPQTRSGTYGSYLYPTFSASMEMFRRIARQDGEVFIIPTTVLAICGQDENGAILRTTSAKGTGEPFSVAIRHTENSRSVVSKEGNVKAGNAQQMHYEVILNPHYRIHGRVAETFAHFIRRNTTTVPVPSEHRDLFSRIGEQGERVLKEEPLSNEVRGRIVDLKKVMEKGAWTIWDLQQAKGLLRTPPLPEIEAAERVVWGMKDSLIEEYIAVGNSKGEGAYKRSSEDLWGYWGYLKNPVHAFRERWYKTLKGMSNATRIRLGSQNCWGTALPSDWEHSRIFPLSLEYSQEAGGVFRCFDYFNPLSDGTKRAVFDLYSRAKIKPGEAVWKEETPPAEPGAFFYPVAAGLGLLLWEIRAVLNECVQANLLTADDRANLIRFAEATALETPLGKRPIREAFKDDWERAVKLGKTGRLEGTA